MSDPRTAPYAAIRLADVPQSTGPSEGRRRRRLPPRPALLRRPGVRGQRRHGERRRRVIEEHDERDDSEYGTEGHEELFAVLSGHAVFTVDGEEVDAPAGTLVFVRDPAIKRGARATADGTEILAVGARPGAPFAVSRWEQSTD